jgi:hypothetical protein
MKLTELLLVIAISLGCFIAIRAVEMFFADAPVVVDDTETQKDKQTVKVTTIKKPDGTEIKTQVQIVEHENIIEKTKLLSVPKPQWSLGLSAQVRPSLSALNPTFTAEVGRRLLGPAWGVGLVTFSPKEITGIGVGLRVEF